MGKKLTYEFVKESFEKESYTLLSTEYISNNTKLKYICPKGHTHSITWCKWKQGVRCRYCFGNNTITYEFVKSEFENIKYTLLSKHYVNARTKLYYVCDKSHYGSTNWDNFYNKGRRCAICAGQRKPTIKELQKIFKKENYELVSKDYTNAHVKLDYICPEGHKHSISFNNWYSGYRCPTCYRLNNFGENHHNWLGGISLENYCEAWKDKEYKQDIRNRDGNTCLNPYCDSPNKNDLTIHHIDYDKKNCKPSNLITVCRSCNSKANINRNWHKSWYTAVLFKRYNYGLK